MRVFIISTSILVGCPKQDPEVVLAELVPADVMAWSQVLRVDSAAEWQTCLHELPEDLALGSGPLTTCVVPTVDRQGVLLGLVVTESSGVAALDACAERGVRVVFPMDPPPPAMLDDADKLVPVDLCFEAHTGR